MSLKHARLQELFLAACDLPEAQQRALVADQCADDPALRQELQSLLRSDARKDGIFTNDNTTDGIQFQFDTVVESELPKQIGRYDVQEILGEGGMGVVYLAKQQNPSRDVAVKVIRSGMVSPDLLKRFEIEAAVLGRLSHPGIAKIYEAGVFVDGATGQERPFLAMEYVDGQPLRNYFGQSNPSSIQKVREVEAPADTFETPQVSAGASTSLATQSNRSRPDSKFSTRDRLQLFVQICEAVHHAHQRGVIHRDLKPGNILVKDDGLVSILDFGVARATAMDHGMSTLQTRAGQLIGTLPYMSPEQVTGNSLDVDTRSDVYSLGVIAYELLSGKLPYDVGKAEYLKAAKVIAEDLPVPLASVRREFRGELNTIVHKALEKEPDRRYQSAKAMGDDVQRYLNDQPIVAMPTGALGRVWKWCQRNKAIAALLSLLALAIMLGFVGITRQTFNALESKRLAEDSAHGTARVLDLLVSSFRSPDPTIDGRDVKMVDVLIQAVSDLEEDSTEDPLITARLLNAIGESFQTLGIYDQGERVHKLALEIRMRELGEEHPDTMASMANLAALSFQAGNHEEALRLFIRSKDLRTRVLGEEHPDTLKSMNDLAVGYQAHANWDEAIKLYEQTFQVMQRTLGASHLDTLKAMSNIGRFHFQRGDYDQALPIAEQFRLLSKQSLGERHPTAIKAVQLLAVIYNSVRPVEEALPLHLEVLDLNRNVLGDEHPVTLSAIANAADAFLNCNNETEAIRLLEDALPAFKEKLGDNHWQTILSMMYLDRAYLFADRPDEALPLLEEADQLQESLALTLHQRVWVRTYLAKALLRTDQREKGIEMLEECLHARLAEGDNGPESLAITAYAYLEAGMYAEAEPYLRDALDQLNALADPNNWGQFIAQAALGESLAQQGKHEEAKPLLLSGARGLRDVKDGPPFPSPRQIADTLSRVIRFYELTEQPDQADKWRQIAENDNRSALNDD